MKKIIIAISVLVLGVFASCEIQKGPEDPVSGEQVTIHVSIPATKVALSPDGEGLHLAWQAGDCIRVVSGSNSSVFTINDGFTDHEADFTGTAVEGSKFDIIYPGDAESVMALESSYPGDQVQEGNGSTAHLKYAACLTGVNSYKDVAFTPAWAESKGGEMLRPGAIKLQMTLPAGAAGMEKVAVSVADMNLNLGFKNVDVSADSQVLTAYAMLPFGDIELEAVNPISVTAIGTDASVYGISFNLPADKTLKAGGVSVFKLTTGVTEAPFAGGDGTEDAPYLLGNAKHLSNMSGVLSSEHKVFFKMVKDIDASSIENWTPLNAESPYKNEIDFDGDGHSISNFSCANKTYASFFGVVYGVCKNVSFIKADISSNLNSACAILGGYAGSGDLHADISNVHVQGKVTFTGNKTGIGGLCGTVGNATFNACSADCEVHSGKNYVGGLFGYSKKVSATNCYSSGSVRGDQRVGGLCGGLLGENDSLENCFSNATLDGTSDYAATRSVGGIVGHTNLDKADGNETRMPNNVVKGCIAWQDAIKTRTYLGETATGDYYSSGAIVAFTATHNYLVDCYRKASLDFRDYADSFLLYDQENASPDVPLVIKPVEGCTHNYPYHGKAADPGKTLSQVAQDLGWSSEVWDFSTDIPTLK